MHQPVLLREALEALAIKPEGRYIDATFGRGGHAQEIRKRLTTGKLCVVDQDPEALAYAKQVFENDGHVEIWPSSFEKLEILAKHAGLAGKVDGILMDLGVSSPQLDQAERGFSFMKDGPLDMRMDPTQGEPLSRWLAKVSEAQLSSVIQNYGEERFAKRIAQAIIRARGEKPLLRTQELAEIVAKAHPAWEAHRHPATRTFQALRIFINRELEVLKAALWGSISVLAPGGRLAVISFHSLEEEVVKAFTAQFVDAVDLSGFPFTEAELAKYKVMRKVGKVIKPTEAEVQQNMRARSARLRVFERL